MIEYSHPEMDILIFDEEEVVTASITKARYSADLMNEYFLDDKKGNASQTTTVRLQDIQVTTQ